MMILDLFAGPGGWDEGIRLLQSDVPTLGVEWDPVACETRAAAGHLSVRADIEHLPIEPFLGKVRGVIMSPPCPDWSIGGKGARLEGDSGRLVMEVPRWVEALRPEWIACEQVPPVLDLWLDFAERFRRLGYSTWAGVLNAADFGVPQTRRRAILLGSLARSAVPPEPTHEQGGGMSLFGERLPWVTMAEALGWERTTRVGFLRLDDRGDSPDGYRERDWRDGDEPSFTLGEKSRSWTVELRHSFGESSPDSWTDHRVPGDRPAPTVDTKARAWAFERPATTIQGDPRCWPPGHKLNADDERRLGAEAAAERYGDRAGTEAIRLDIRDALVLQSFRPDYPVRGSRTKQFEQVGNAVPPRFAAHLVSAISGYEFRAGPSAP